MEKALLVFEIVAGSAAFIGIIVSAWKIFRIPSEKKQAKMLAEIRKVQTRTFEYL